MFVAGSSAASAQTNGTITGVVKDTTGAVLPGVTVEAASPVLIEKVRTVVTDGEGLYRIIELRPGSYTVTFSLPGFNTVRREGLELNAGFAATVNTEMRVGSLEETITVSGRASTVDTQNVTQQRVLTRALMDDLPIGTKTVNAMGALIPGMIAASHDVGGASRTSGAAISMHGSRTGEEQLLQNGMTYNTGNGRGGGFSAVRANETSTQEVSVETSGLVLNYNPNFSVAAPPRSIASPATYDWPVPQTIVQGRIMKIGFQLDW